MAWQRNGVALGIGVNSTIFTFANAAFFRGMPGIGPPAAVIGYRLCRERFAASPDITASTVTMADRSQ